MTKQFDIIYATRRNFTTLVNTLTIDQLNKIPAGYNNNIAWIFCHIIAVQQVLCYQRANVNPLVSEDFILRFRNGSKPEGFISQQEIDESLAILMTTVETFERDITTGIFANYTAFRTMYGVEITSIDDAVQYLPVHDALHYGYSLSLKKNLV